MFKLNLKLCLCCSVLRPGTNQKWFQHTFQWCAVFHVLKQDGAVILKKCEEKFQTKENFDKKNMNNHKHLANGTLIVLKQY